MLYTQKLNIFSRKNPLVTTVYLVLALLSATMLVGIDTAHADSPEIKSVLSYCQAHIPAKAKQGCTLKNADAALNARVDECKKVQSDQAKYIKCTVGGAEDLIDQAIKQNPKDGGDFTKKLNALIKKTGGANGGFNNNGGGCSNTGCTDPSADPNTNCNNDNGCDLVKKYVNPFIKVLSLTVGLVVAASLVLGGIQYSASSGDPQRISAAKSRITQTLLALLAYAFLYSFLNFLIPGGIF